MIVCPTLAWAGQVDGKAAGSVARRASADVKARTDILVAASEGSITPMHLSRTYQFEHLIGWDRCTAT